MKISEIVEKLEAYHGPLDPNRRTCDGIIAGDPNKECTGVVTTCCPSAAVIKKAAELGANFIICHEPTFFDGWDETDWQAGHQTYRLKRKLIEETGMVIYRDHDHIHGQDPDGIFTGLVKKLGWEKYQNAAGFMPGAVFDLPKAPLREVAAELAKVMQIDGMRILGDPDMEVSRAAITFHFLGNDMDRGNLKFIEENDIEVIIPGEVVDWTVGEYVLDSLTLGRKRALLNPGHFNWEEPGMEYMAQWLPEVLGGEVPVTFVQSGNAYKWLDFTH